MTTIKKNQAGGRMAMAAILTMGVVGCAAVNTPPASVAAPGPQGAPGTAEGCKADRLGDNALIGKPEREAVDLLAGCPWRIGMRDGKRFPGTMDYLENRRTLSIVNGRVVEVKRG
jgi:hypothetical protein